MTGNTVIDALHWTLDRIRHGQVRLPAEVGALGGGRRLALVTAHRRENFDEGLRNICGAIRTLAGPRPSALLDMGIQDPHIRM